MGLKFDTDWSTTLRRESGGVRVKEYQEKDRQFTYEICSESFKTRESLRRHEMAHTGEQPFVSTHVGKFRYQCGMEGASDETNGSQALEMPSM